MYFFQKCLPSPVLARRYSAYATAFTRTRLSWLGVWRDQPSPGEGGRKFALFQETVSLVLVERYSVHATAFTRTRLS